MCLEENQRMWVYDWHRGQEELETRVVCDSGKMKQMHLKHVHNQFVLTLIMHKQLARSLANWTPLKR